MNTYTVFSTDNANGVEGKKRCFFDELLKDFKHIYEVKYLVEFFEKKAQEYFYKAIEEDEKYYEGKRQKTEYTIDYSKEDNYLKVTKILRIMKKLQYFHDRGYDFKIVSISIRQNGWIMEIAFDLNNLTQDQLNVFTSNTFEDEV